MVSSMVQFSVLMWVNPLMRMVHSVANAVTIMVIPRAENPNRRKNVMRNPKPPISIMWMSITTTGYKEV